MQYCSRQACQERQCQNLNPRVKKNEASVPTENELVETTDPVEMNEDIFPGDVHIETDNEVINLVVENIVNDIISTAWCELKSHVVLKSQKQPNMSQKPKCYECDKCHTKFAQLASAKKHCKYKAKGTTCHICGVELSEKRNLKRHLKNHNKVKTNKLTKEVPKCNECGITFARKHKLKEHMKNKHEEVTVRKGGDALKCTECDFQNYSKSRIKAHYTLNHSEASGKFKCDLCNFVCKSLDGLYKHRKSIHMSREDQSSSSEFDINSAQTNNLPDRATSAVQTQEPSVMVTGVATQATRPITMRNDLDNYSNGLATQTLVPATMSVGLSPVIRPAIRTPLQTSGVATLANCQASQFTLSGMAGSRSGNSRFEGINWEEYQNYVNDQYGSAPNVATEREITFLQM